MDDAKGFKKRLAKAIQASGVAKGELAEAASVEAARVSEWLRDPSKKGAAMPTTENLLAITKKLGVSAHWLLTGDGDMVAPPGLADQVLEKIRALVNPQPSAMPDEGEGAMLEVDLLPGQVDVEKRGGEE